MTKTIEELNEMSHVWDSESLAREWQVGWDEAQHRYEVIKELMEVTENDKS